MSIEERLVRLEARVRAAEDQLEILALLHAYGPLVDGGASGRAAELWIPGGEYSFSGEGVEPQRLEAPDGLISLYEGPWHRELVNAGSAHLTATPTIAVKGDEAEAVGFSFVVRREGEHWCVLRAAVNRWTLRRTPAGWRIVERVNRVLDGSSEARRLMRTVSFPRGDHSRIKEAAHE